MQEAFPDGNTLTLRYTRAAGLCRIEARQSNRPGGALESPAIDNGNKNIAQAGAAS